MASMADVTGLLAAAAAVALFGVFSLPTKTTRTGDGIFFQWLICSGIFVTGLCTHMALCSEERGCPVFIPVVAVGGSIWCAANLLLVPIVDCIGMGLTMMLWGLLEMLTGWATARFGWFGVAAEHVGLPAANAAGVCFALLSLAALVGVNPTSVTEHSAARSASGATTTPLSGSSEEGGLLHEVAPSTGKVEEEVRRLLVTGYGSIESEQAHLQPLSPPPPRPAVSDVKWTDAMTPSQKRAFGAAACTLAGCLSGSTFTPAQAVVDATNAWVAGGGSPSAGSPYPGASTRLLSHILAHFTGIWLTSTLILIVYLSATAGPVCGGRRGGCWVGARQVYPESVLPGILSGLTWGCAMVAWFLANEHLSIVIAFPLVTMGPGLVAVVIGAVVFKEVEGWRNYALIALSVACYLAGSVLIVLSN